MKTPRIKNRNRMPREANEQMNRAFYGALNVINKAREARGEEPFPVPDKYKPRRARPIMKGRS